MSLYYTEIIAALNNLLFYVYFSENLWNDTKIVHETRPSAEEKEKQKNTRGDRKDQPTGLRSKEKLKALLIDIDLELKTHEPRWPDQELL